jgi:cytoskeleton protein RodZ
MQSIGERLEEARKRKGISIREAAESTKIRGEYLHKFESNQFDIKLPEIYVRGFLRTYANYLRLPGEKIINDYNGLGLNADPKGRGLNREVYGRMDLSVSSAKPERENNDPNAPTHTTEPADNAGTRNPATFVPRPALNIAMDRNLIVKGAAIVIGVIILVLLAIWIFSGHGGGADKPRPEAPSAPAVIWKKPLPGDPSFALVAIGRVYVTATYFDGTVFFQGTIPAGEVREIPRPGKKITVRTDTPEYLKLRIDRTDYDMRDKNQLRTEMFVDEKGR